MRNRAAQPLGTIREEQILAAAETCFRRHGFHAASMAQIAHEAKMSVGQIYRHFDNKEAIVGAIIRRDMRAPIADMQHLETHGGDPAAAIMAYLGDEMERLASPERAALNLEIMAEAARNPKVKALVSEADREWRDHARALLSKNLKQNWPAGELEARIDVISLLFEGLPFRTVQNPGMDRDRLKRRLGAVLAALFAKDR
jgi:AcrR family transcriptional regulator